MNERTVFCWKLPEGNQHTFDINIIVELNLFSFSFFFSFPVYQSTYSWFLKIVWTIYYKIICYTFVVNSKWLTAETRGWMLKYITTVAGRSGRFNTCFCELLFPVNRFWWGMCLVSGVKEQLCCYASFLV